MTAHGFKNETSQIAWDQPGLRTAPSGFKTLNARKRMEKGVSVQGDPRDTRMLRASSVSFR